MICDLNGSLGSQQFLNIVNERTCFTSCTCAFKSSRFKKILQKLQLKGTTTDPGPLNMAVPSCNKLASRRKRLPEELNDRLVRRLEFHECAYKRIDLTPHR